MHLPTEGSFNFITLRYLFFLFLIRSFDETKTFRQTGPKSFDSSQGFFQLNFRHCLTDLNPSDNNDT